MAVCLDFQQVYSRRREVVVVSVRAQVILLLALLALVSVKIWSQVKLTDFGYRLGHERARALELEGTVRELELARSVLLRPQYLEREARRRLGFAPLKPQQATVIHSTESGI